MTRSAGYHGKIPAQGDFIQRGLPTSFTRAWDRWLMEGIAAMKERRGDAWLDGYRTAPVWRFAVPAGAFGEKPMVGVLMASVDRVGRNFPLTIAAEAPPAASSFAALLAEAGMLDRMAATALGALGADARKDALDAAVDAIVAGPSDEPDIAETSEALTVRGADPTAAIAARWLERRYGADAAVFISDAPQGGERQLIATRGAPTVAIVAQLFEGGAGASHLDRADDDPDLLAPLDVDVSAPVVAMAAAPLPTARESSPDDSDAEDDLDALIGGPLDPGAESPPPLAPADPPPDLPPELDPDFDPVALPDPLEADVSPPAATPPTAPPTLAALPPSEARPVTDDELDALIGSDPLSGEDPAFPPAPPRAAEDEDEDDPIAAILAGGGPET